MSDMKSTGFPWASLAVLAAFVTSTQLVPHAFDQLRPAERERAQSTLGGALEVDARLWEDPFAAVRRHEGERLERCDKLYKSLADAQNCKLSTGKGERAPEALRRQLDRDDDSDLRETLLIAALVPGNPFVGAEEGRRRARYALLAGLAAKDYVPDNAERIGLMEFTAVQLADPADLASPVSGAASAASAVAMPAVPASAATTAPPAKLIVPYELLSNRRSHREPGSKNQTARYEQIALLWIDESALPASKLNALARLLAEVMRANRVGSRPALAIIGPSSTDALRVALADLKQAARWPACPPKPGEPPQCLDDKAREGYALMTLQPPNRAEILNPNSTAHNNILDELETQKLGAFLNERFTELLRSRAPLEVDYRRMIATDNELIKRLVGELRLRLPAQTRRRLVLVAERDSLYAQSLVNEFQHRVQELMGERGLLSIEVVYYLRGIDGVTTRDAQRDGADKGGDAKTPRAELRLEWPEARDQLDYLRRLAQSLKQSESVRSRGPIGAIGILGSDVHDKLLVLQALHDTFSDKVFFTTDMDARFLHPRTQGFTRNLVVASSLPLEFYPPSDPGRINLQAGTPPLRDVYQASAYLAARHAACREERCKQDERAAAALALDHPSLYEIGRSRAVPLSGYALEQRSRERPLPRLLLGGALALALAVGLLIWPSTPALQQAWRGCRWNRAGAAPESRMSRFATALVALHAAVAGFVLCSLIEFVQPGHLRFVTMLLVATLAAFCALLVLWPSYSAMGGGTPAGGAAAEAMGWAQWLPPLAALPVFAWLAWPDLSLRPCSSCEPVTWLEGVSAWPSHLIHLVALVLLLCTLDHTWAKTRRDLRRDAHDMRLPASESPALEGGGPRALLRHWFKHVGLLSWTRPPGLCTDVAQIWKEYTQRGARLPRVARTLIWYGVTLALVGVLYYGLSEGEIPEVPVRGSDHRMMVRATLYAVLALLPLLIVAVADATLLAYRFIQHLNSGRSCYPPETAEHFARALGDGQAERWATLMAGRPAERHGEGLVGPRPAHAPPLRHCLLDDWIDVQLVAARSASIAPLVIGPFAVLALLVVARSRLFDNWALTPAIAFAACFYLLWLVLIAVLLKYAAEQTRRRALLSMNADLRWLAGHPDEGMRGLVEPFKRLIAAVESNQTGAFAPLFEQPLLRALLVPLGGAGGAQLFDYMLLAR